MKQRTVAKDIPLSEVTFRKYERPSGLPPRELVKKLCLSVGLLQPGDSRDIVVDVLHALIMAERELSSVEVRGSVIRLREDAGLALAGIAASNIRRQLKRLREIYVVEKVKNSYRITEMAPIGEAFEEKVERFLLPSIMDRVKEYIDAVDQLRPGG
ncbi:hypothetical protein JXB02_04665 [Candidatus Woesearchaeota archaeon]|nr:hypothetical protein [Candidatus Woesearchaeota archaeon]